MAGLALKVGGFGGVGATSSPAYGTPDSYATVTQAAFGPGATVQAPTTKDCLMPNDGFGVAFWVGVAAVAALVLIRHSLPG
jgi:hypothetical protein